MAGPNLKGSPQSSSISRGDTARIAAINLTTAPQKPKLLDQVRHAIRTRHYSPRTEETYVHWIKRFIFFHNKRHPEEMGEKEIAQFLSSLASEQRVSASTQNQALNAILFLYPPRPAQRHWLRRRRCPGQQAEEATDGFDAPGSQVYFRLHRQLGLAHGHVALWSRPPTDGMFAATGEGYRFHH